MRVIIKVVTEDGSNWEDRWDQTFESAADAKVFIDLITDYGVEDQDGDDMMDLNVVFDLNEEAFVIYAEE